MLMGYDVLSRDYPKVETGKVLNEITIVPKNIDAILSIPKEKYT